VRSSSRTSKVSRLVAFGLERLIEGLVTLRENKEAALGGEIVEICN